ncbi:MAG: Polyketide synthase type [Gemmatimonadetes bacterium]|nr:Polyketide synthase type [Gemmatimonadota bacterium]
MADQTAHAGHADEVAVVGMAGRFSKAADVEAFWRNLVGGVECITFFGDDELLAAGVSADDLALPGYVRAKGVLEDAELFDAAFFGFSPREAEVMDPQIRNFLETAWTAMEHAGYGDGAAAGSVGVFAGASSSSWMLHHLLNNNGAALFALGGMQMGLLTGNGFVSTWTSYKLNLRGPSMSLATACSTSLVAVHVAAQSLLNGECGMALAGGVGISFPTVTGYLYDEGSISSKDGHTRSFDHEATGTISGSGVGVVVLKRMDDALADGDTIYAVVKGSAVNNDGSMKIGYTAPSVDGQAEVIAEAHAIAGIDPATLGMVECHGSATPLGDPIEAAALAQAFKGSAAKSGSVAIGSVKSNLGHLDTGAGIAGFLKAVQAVRHGVVPPSLGYRKPNKQIDLAAGPFYVPTEARPWPADAHPRRAGVSSFGIGGTNAHVVVEQAPEPEPSRDRPWQVIPLSARTPAALETAARNLTAWLRANPGASLADAAYTLQVGRRTFAHRRALVAQDVADAASVLAGSTPARVMAGAGEPDEHPVVFLLPGDGAQHAGMGQELYAEGGAFREAMDECAEILRPLLGLDVREAIYPATEDDVVPIGVRLAHPALGQPALFATEYALAKQWMEWGVQPAALAGHGVGEYVAACLAGVLALPDALALVAARGAALQALGDGANLIVTRGAAEVTPHLSGDVHLLSDDGPGLCVLSGPPADMAETERRLAERGIQVFRQPVFHALRASAAGEVAAAFAEVARSVPRGKPAIPTLSGVTGTWLTAADLADPAYWERQTTGTIRFGAGLRELYADPARILLEVGPAALLTGVVRTSPEHPAEQPVVPSLMRGFGEPERAALLRAVAALWVSGRSVDWKALQGGEPRRRIALPTYPFERRHYSIGAAGRPTEEQEAAAALAAAEPAAPTMHARPNLQNDYVAPRDEPETAITGIWQELFGIEPIGVYDNFFELGGHSLMGTQVMSRVRVALGADVPVRVLFEGPTVAQLAAAIAAGAGAGGAVQAIQRADAGEDAADLLARLDDLSEEEMEALLAELSAGEEG